MRTLVLAGLLMLAASPAFAQSLHLRDGERAVSAGIGWSVGPSSNGVESGVGVAVGRTEFGLGLNRYTFTADDGSESPWTEYAPYVRVFLVREHAGAPVSIAVGGQVFLADYEADDSGTYGQVGATLFKSFTLTHDIGVHPYIGFAFVAESYTFGGGDPERAQYLTRDLGVHVTTAADRPWVLQATLLEQSFRRETYRSARVSVIRRF
jgi:hypothetical protein